MYIKDPEEALNFIRNNQLQFTDFEIINIPFKDLDDSLLEQFLKDQPTLTDLRIKAENLTDKSLEKIAESCKNLQSLAVCGSFTATGLSTLASLRQLHHLEFIYSELNLKNSPDNLTFPTVKKLILKQCTIQEADCKKLIFPTIEELVIYRPLGNITEASVAHLTSFAKKTKVNFSP